MFPRGNALLLQVFWSDGIRSHYVCSGSYRHNHPSCYSHDSRLPKGTMSRSTFSMSPVRLIALVLFLLTVVLFSRVRDFEFVNFDDPSYVTENLQVQNGLTKEGLAWAFGRVHGDDTYWHPLTWVSHMLDYELFGPQPGVHHLVNVLFHALAAVLLFHTLRRMTRALWRSAIV